MQEWSADQNCIRGGLKFGTLNKPSHNHHMHRTAKSAAADVNR